MVAQMVAMTLAQALLSTGDPKTTGLFLLCGVLLGIGGLPILAARSNAPNRPPPEPFGIPKLFAVSPMGVIATTLSGVAWSVVFTFGPVYAQGAGFDLHGVSLFMGVAMVASAVIQYPLGWISDHIGRRLTVGLMCAGGTAASAFGWWADGEAQIFKLIGSAAIGALTFPLYTGFIVRGNGATGYFAVLFATMVATLAVAAATR